MILIFVILIGIVQASNDKLEQLETLIHDVEHLNNEANDLKQENWNLKMENQKLSEVLDAKKIGTPVIFAAVRKSALGEYNHVKPGADITFTEMVTNIGNGMDPETGVFKAPVTGVYEFSISAESNIEDPTTSINVFKNDEYEFRITDLNQSNQKNHVNIAYTWCLELVQDETVKLAMSNSNGLFVNYQVFVWFNGYLMSNPVIFSVIRKAVSEEYNNVEAGAILTFTETITNIGKGMDLETGVFQAPVSGLYTFSLSAETNIDNFVTTIEVYKNNVYQFRITDLNRSNGNHFNNMAYSWIFELIQGETVKLKMSKDNGLVVKQDVFVWFNGHLLLEQ